MSQALSLTGVKGGVKNVQELAKALKVAVVAQGELNAAVKASPAEKITIRHRDAVSATNQQMMNSARLLRTLGALTGGAFSVYGIRRFLSSLIEITGQFEVQKMALRTMLQDIDAADKIFQDLYRFSSDSTYRFSELAKYSKQLAAFNIGKDSLLETTKMLGDVASGVGVSMDRLILAYGHVKSSGFLRGIQLRSFSQNGVPILDELAKMFTEIEGKAVSLGDVFDKMTRREIPFEMVEEAFKRMTSEGGKFYQMQEVLSKTLAGQMNILKGRWENLMYAVGQSQEGLLKGAVGRISNLIADYERFGKTVRDLAISFGIYKATQLVILAITDKMAFANLRLVKTFQSLSLSNPYMLLAAAIGAAAYAIYKQQTALSDVEKLQKSVNKSIDDFNKTTNTEIGELDALYAKLKLAQEGTEGYASAKKAIETRFGTYINQLKDEGVAVDNLAVIYENLAAKIRNANKERFLESSMSDLGKVWSDVQNDINSEFDKIVKGIEKDLNRSLTAMEKLALNQSITGSIAEGKEGLVADTIGAMYAELEKKGGKKAGAQGRRNSGVYGQAQVISKEEVSSYADRLQALTKRYSDGMTQYADSVTELNDAFETLNRSVAATKKEGEELFYDVNSIVAGIKKLDTEISALRNKARSGFITQDEKDRLDALVKEREEAAKEYKDIMGVDYDKDVKRYETASSKRVNALKSEVGILNKYYTTYRALEPFLGEETASKMKELFGDGRDYSTLDEQINRLIDDMKGMGEEGRKAAEELEASLGRDEGSRLVKRLTEEQKATERAEAALQKYLDALEQWRKKDPTREGTGALFKLSKAISGYRESNSNADITLRKNTALLPGAFSDPKAQMRELSKLWALWARDKAGALDELRNSVVGLTDDIFKEAMSGYDLTNWNDKTLGQILEIKGALENIKLPDAMREQLKDFPEILKMLEDALRGYSQNVLDNTVNPESNKKFVSYMQKGAQYLSKAADYMRELADLSGDSELGDFATATGAIAQNLQAAAEGFAAAESAGAGAYAWIGAVAGGVIDIIKQISAAAAENHGALENFRQSLEQIAEEARVASFKNSLASTDSIFGENTLEKIGIARQQMIDLRKEMEKFSNLTIGTKKSSWWDRLFSRINNEKVDDFSQYGKIIDLLNMHGLEAYDENGILNKESVQALITLYGDADGTLQKLVDDIDAYHAAMDAVSSAMESIFGDIASSAADTIIDQWIEAGDAALDYADILDDVARSYAKMLIESSILDSVFDTNEIERVKQMFLGGDYEGAMAAIAGDMEQIAGMEPVFQQILEAFDPYFNKESSGGTLANGIKGITEDTANLLASYLNAIRADVSFLRAMAQQGWANVENISVSLAALPSLADYMVRIEAHNANTAENTRQILSELRGVISSSSGRRAFAVEVQ
ncbi:MAG: hypothetical protein J5382_10325 [Bacteroidales bacterium]|nr:hypothetical protein [Bacteroidales bacterium]